MIFVHWIRPLALGIFIFFHDSQIWYSQLVNKIEDE